MSAVSKAELARVSPDGRGIKPLRGLGSSYNSTGSEGIQHAMRGQKKKKSGLMNGFSVSTFTLHLKQLEKKLLMRLASYMLVHLHKVTILASAVKPIS